ncbi:kinase-like protein [Coniochaeta ligniaria NRRL 30616]|uniref:non-specific serine/threonine protein kinase n=1 Tax=Coniochaeta ligniaria NRRL 30616 TaxID=1408157 RepID=A0A1J7IMY9_9PEZI|nr:kinase-like protein [Coniochaeta ligniaria NRRL 30616]
MTSPNMSSDEGEIIEATSLPQRKEGGDVDRSTRKPGRSSQTPEYTGPARHPGDGRPRNNDSPRGHKRPRDDRDSYSGGRGRDPRRFKVHYEGDTRNDTRGGRHSYEDHDFPPTRGSYQHEDSDRPGSRSSNTRFGGRDALPSRPSGYRQDGRDQRSELDYDHDGYSDKRPRNRSRSPRGRHERGKRDRGRFGRDQKLDQAESIKYSAHAERQSPGNSASKRATPAKASDTQRHDAKYDQGASGDRAVDRNATSQERYQPAADLDFDDVSPADKEAAVEAEIARRRRLREEALKRAIGANTPNLQSLHVSEKPSESTSVSTQANTPQRTEANTPRSATGIHSPIASASGAHDASLSPAALDITNDQELINTHVEAKVIEEDGPSAADYDPTADMKEDERRDEMRHGHVGLHGQDRHPSQAEIAVPKTESPSKKQTAQDDDDDEFDMFADDFDDEKFAPPEAATKTTTATEKLGDVAELAQPTGGGILEGDDKDGYYKMRPGEVLGGRYQVQSALGKGMFSGVARAMDITTKELVAIKIMRNNDALRKGGFTEIAILEKLNAADPENKKHIVKFERWFEYKDHLCMAFENLSLNLREVLKKFGNNIGININATRAYAYQIFVALAHMRKCTIIHADLKPDNILVNETRNVLKICDLGTAIDKSDAATAHNDVTPYLVSRFYRAPEIILGMPYDYAVDMWSIGCTLYELYTGKILFTGDSNNQMLKNIMEVRGKMSAKLYRRGQLSHLHFDDMGNFISIERDKLGKTAVRTLPMVKPTRDLRTRLLAASSGMDDAEMRELNHFIDLLERCLALNPDKRITPTEALRHPFITQRAHASGR